MSSVTGPRDSALRPLSGVFQPDASPTKPMPKAALPEPSVHYTCFIRLPFPRGDFVDPQQVEWSSAKDRLLWKTISKTSNSKELDWEELSTRFDVSLPFLLQQAAWLYERHFAQMKAQMKKLSPSTNPSPIPPDSASNASTPLIGTFATNSLGPRTTSALSIRTRESPTPTAVGSGSIRPTTSSSIIAMEAPFPTYTVSGPSRTPSLRTVTESRTATTGSPVVPSNRSFRSSFGSQQRKITTQAPQQQDEETADYDSPPPASPSPSSSSSSSDDEIASQSLARSQAFRRPSHFGGAAKKPGLPLYDDDDADDDEDGESSGGFLPFAASSRHEDPAATLRSPPPPKRALERTVDASNTSSEGSAAAATEGVVASVRRHGHQQQHHQQHQHGHHGQHASGKSEERRHQQQQQVAASALSPKQRAELALLSPRLRREGSEGTPSMGSSFSDLDDASISQSALEDAYLSNMQRGGTASRMSTISQALKSRYL